MNSKYKYLLKNFLLFSIGNFLPKVLTFIMVPLYTNCLSTSDYGIADFINTTISLLLPILTLNIQDAVLRFSLDKNYKKEEIFSTSIGIILLGTMVLSIGLFVYNFAFSTLTITNYIGYFLVMYLSHAMYNSVTMFARGIDKVSVIVTASIINTFLTVVLNLLFLLYFVNFGLHFQCFSLSDRQISDSPRGCKSAPCNPKCRAPNRYS